jgi:hypothetical protein
VQSFRGLRVWEKAHKLTLDVYTSSKAFPREEMYGLTSHAARLGIDRNESRFLQIAMGSASELEYQLLLAHDLDYFRTPEYEHLATQAVEVKRMLSSLMQKVKAVN